MKIEKIDTRREDNCQYAYIGTVYGLGSGPSYVSKCRKTCGGLASHAICFGCKDYEHKDNSNKRKEGE